MTTIPRPVLPGARPRRGHRLRCALICGVVAVPVVASPALAQTVEATGTGQASVLVSKPLTQAKIARAVKVARALAIPRAFINAQTQAGLYATAAGLTIGAVQSVEEPPPNPYGFYGSGVYLTGRFGPNKYCGNVTRVKRKRVNGQSRVVSRTKRFQCSKPEFIAVSLYVEFAASPAPMTPPA